MTDLVPPPDTGPVAEQTYSRRGLIQHLLGIGATGLAAAVGGATALEVISTPLLGSESGSDTRRKFRYGMVIDTRRCVGCKACMVACKTENKTPSGVSYTVVVDNEHEHPDGKPLFMTKPCFHCEQPPCTDVCPVGATFKREQDGIVAVDYDRCIGCRYCITACPYQARYFDFGENYAAQAVGSPLGSIPSPEYKQFRKRTRDDSPIGNVRKCTFCLHLQNDKGNYDQQAGRWPSCAKTCTGHAIFFGDFLDRESLVSRMLRERQAIRLKEELGINPNVYYLL
jgi:molybdopterin-containing oxidoreductase family iron-sulfur binding subunit